MHGRADLAVSAGQLERLVPGTRFVEQGGNDRGDVGAGDRASGDRRGCEPDPAGGRSVGQAARAQDGPVQVPGAQIGLGGGLRRDVGGPDLITAGPRRCAGSIEETCTNLRTPARSAASAISTEAARSTESLRGAAARTGAGREYHRVSPGQQHRDITG